MTKIRVILADDHPVVRAGICALLGRANDIEVVAEATNGHQVLALVEEFKPDVLILDIEMPELTGIDVARLLRQQESAVRILALSAHVDEHYVYKVLQSGASGYLMKEETPDMIIDAVRGVAQGEEGWMSRRAAAQMNTMARNSQQNQELTPREQEVLQHIVKGKTNQEIAHVLHIAESTVEKHVGAMMTKLQVSSRVEAAVHAVRKGLV